MEQNLYLTVKEIAQELRVTKVTINRIIKDGGLPAIKVRGRYRVDQQDFDNYKKGEKKE